MPDALFVEVFRLYGKGECVALRTAIERADLSQAPPEHQASFDLLQAFCAEREGEILSAKDRYAALIAKWPHSVKAYEAALRLRELERFEKLGTTREELKKRADEARESPLYQHGAKPLQRGSPLYPPGPAAAGVEGSVLVDFEISRSGGATDLVVLGHERWTRGCFRHLEREARCNATRFVLIGCLVDPIPHRVERSAIEEERRLGCPKPRRRSMST